MTIYQRNRSARYEPSLILFETASYYHRTVKEVIGHRRFASLAIPRHIAMYLIRRHTRLSLEEIGIMFSDRDHTTVLYGVNTTRECLKCDGDLARRVKEIERLIDLHSREHDYRDELIENLQGLA